jgi:Na+-driven multidrug efflux pump
VVSISLENAIGQLCPKRKLAPSRTHRSEASLAKLQKSRGLPSDVPENRRQLFLEGPIGSALFRLAVPIVLGNLLQTGYQLTDAFWVGRLGGPAVAAVAVSFPVTFLVIALGAGLAIAGATLSAQYMGAGRQDMVNHVAAQTMLMVAITSVFMGGAGYVLSPHLLKLIGVAPDVYQGALGFMRVSFVGIILSSCMECSRRSCAGSAKRGCR